MKITLRIFSIVGVILFGSSFVFTYSVPEFVENIGREFIKKQIETKTQEKIGSIKLKHENNVLVQLAAKVAKNNEQKIQKIREQLINKIYSKIADVIAEMRDLDCECRTKYEKMLKKGAKFKIISLQNANRILLDFMKTKYMEVAYKLKTDLRIFTGSNTVVFALLLLISFTKPQAIKHLFLPGILLGVSTIICSYFYLFNQNWFFTIIYNEYTGWGYLAYLGVIFAFLCDITFNKARITTNIINNIISSIGSVSPITPC